MRYLIIVTILLNFSLFGQDTTSVSWQERVIAEKFAGEQLNEKEHAFATELLTRMCACADIQVLEKSKECAAKMINDLLNSRSEIGTGEASWALRKIEILKPISIVSECCPGKQSTYR